MSSARATIWKEAPEPTTGDRPALFYDANKGDLWIAYAVARSSPLRYAVVRFAEVIDHRLSPINDEGLGKQPYYRAGLQFYSFNEVTGSEETKYWRALRPRHWVVTFQDNTLDVIAEDAQVMARDLEASDPVAALMGWLRDTAD
jgi:hypothetical protein